MKDSPRQLNKYVRHLFELFEGHFLNHQSTENKNRKIGKENKEKLSDSQYGNTKPS